MFNEYGIPHATRNKPLTQNNYVEWQIGYDVEEKKKGISNLPHISFVAYNGKKKTLYELSEYLYYFYYWGMFDHSELMETIKFLSRLKEENLLSNHPNCQITRTHPIEKQINNMTFFGMTLKYPQLIYKFGIYEIIAEITIRENKEQLGFNQCFIYAFQ